MKRFTAYIILILFLITMPACQGKDLPSKKPVSIDSSPTEIVSTEISETTSPSNELFGVWTAPVSSYVYFLSVCEDGTLNVAYYGENWAVGCVYYKCYYTIDNKTISVSIGTDPETYSFEYTLENDALYLLNTHNIIFPSEAALFSRTGDGIGYSSFSGIYEQCGPRTSENSGGYFSDFDFWYEYSTYGTYIRYFNLYADGTYSFDLYRVFDDPSVCIGTYHGSYQFVHDGTALRFDNDGVYNFTNLGNGLFILTDNENIMHLYNKISSF